MSAPAGVLLAAFVLGLVWALPLPPVFALPLCASLLTAAAVLARRGRCGTSSMALLTAFALLGGVAKATERRDAPSSRAESLRTRAGEQFFSSPVRVLGTLKREPACLPAACQLRVDALELQALGRTYRVALGLRIRVLGAYRDRLRVLTAGERVRVWATLREPTSFANPGGFDYGRYLDREGVGLVGSTKSALLVERLEGSSSWRAHVSRLRHSVKSRIENALAGVTSSRSSAGVVVALVTGERSGLPPDTERLFQRAGIFHVMAISGAHVAIWVALVPILLQRFGISRRATLVMLAIALPGYAAFCGARAPVLRATAMAGLVVGGRLLGLRLRALNGIGLAALALLSSRPSYLEDAGFQLTFAAMTSLVLFYEPLAHSLRRLSILAPPLAVAIAAQAGVAPLAAWHFHRLSPAAPFAGLPAMMIASAICILGAVLVAVHSVPVVASLVSWLLHALVSALIAGAEIVASLPGTSIPVARPSLVTVLLYIGVLVSWRWSAGRRRLALIVGLSTLALAFATVSKTRSSGVLTMTALDVGHGDAILLSLPMGGHVLIDGGGSPRSTMDIGESVVLPFLLDRGVRRLDAVVSSHSDFDHIGGLAAIVDALAVEELWEATSDWDRAAYRKLRSVASEHDVPIRRLVRGEQFELGGARFEILSAGETGSRSANDRSLVVRVSYQDRAILLTGDAEATLESALSESGPALEADVLKVAHHGSGSSSSARFLDRVRPALAVVSTRAARYQSIPSPEVLDRFRGRGIEVLRTDQDGAITVRIGSDGTLEWSSFRD